VQESIINYKRNKRDVQSYRFLIPILKHIKQYRRVWSLIELVSVYTVPLSAINGLSRLTTMSNGQAQLIQKFSNRPITFQSSRNARFKFESNLEDLHNSLSTDLYCYDKNGVMCGMYV